MALYQYPTDPANYALTRAGKFYPSRRSGPVLGIVLHITAGLEDFDGADTSAEGTAKWAASGAASVSWHVGVDSDSIVPCLPSTYTAWHAAGYNSRTFGIEISKRTVTWSTAPADWVARTLRNAARALAPIVKRYDLPLTLCTKAQVDAAQAAGRPFGFVYHSSTSAGTRTDPGKDFPFARLVEYIRAELADAPAAVTPPGVYPGTALKRGDTGPKVTELQTALGLTADGSYGPGTEAAVTAYQTANGLEVDGITGPQTWASIFTPTSEEDDLQYTPEALDAIIRTAVKGALAETALRRDPAERQAQDAIRAAVSAEVSARFEALTTAVGVLANSQGLNPELIAKLIADAVDRIDITAVINPPQES